MQEINHEWDHLADLSDWDVQCLLMFAGSTRRDEDTYRMTKNYFGSFVAAVEALIAKGIKDAPSIIAALKLSVEVAEAIAVWLPRLLAILQGIPL